MTEQDDTAPVAETPDAAASGADVVQPTDSGEPNEIDIALAAQATDVILDPETPAEMFARMPEIPNAEMPAPDVTEPIPAATEEAPVEPLAESEPETTVEVPAEEPVVDEAVVGSIPPAEEPAEEVAAVPPFPHDPASVHQLDAISKGCLVTKTTFDGYRTEQDGFVSDGNAIAPGDVLHHLPVGAMIEKNEGGQIVLAFPESEAHGPVLTYGAGLNQCCFNIWPLLVKFGYAKVAA